MSNKPRHREKPRCQETGKMMYKSETQALSFGDRAALKSGDTLRAYECPFCSFWHLTHKIDTRRNRPMCPHGVLLAAFCQECFDAPVEEDNRVVEYEEEYARQC